MNREFSVEISLSGFITQRKISLYTSLHSQKNIFLVLPKCPGHLVGFPPQESLFFTFFSFSFFLIFLFEKKAKKTQISWMAFRIQDLSFSLRLVGHLYQHSSLDFLFLHLWRFVSPNKHTVSQSTDLQCFWWGSTNICPWHLGYPSLPIQATKSRVHWIVVTENSPKQCKEKKEGVRTRLLLECIFLAVTQLLETRACGVQRFTSSSSNVFMQGWLSPMDIGTEISPHRTL